MTTPAATTAGTPAAEQLRTARDFLLAHRTDYDSAYAGFAWPRPEHFNFALDWFDGVLAAEHPHHAALRLIEADGTDASYTFGELSARSDQLAGWLRGLGVRRGTHVLVLLGNQVELWETTLAAMKIGAVIIPATTLLAEADLRDRVERGNVGAVIARSDVTAGFAGVPGSYLRVAVGEPVPGWVRYEDSHASLETFVRDEEPTRADDPLLLYFTSGTTALPKLVEHTHVSYPIGHLSTMYWIGLQPGDVHLNVSSPGWAKHAWSCVFAPWLAGATICLYNYERFDARAMLDTLRDARVTTFCAPPTVWRMLVQQDLAAWRDTLSLRELVGAGEPLNPEVIEAVQRGLGITIRDGFGQTESSLQIGNSPGQPIRLGSMGRPMPGFAITLVDPASDEVAAEGEICVECDPRPVGLMVGYRGDGDEDRDRNAEAFAGGRYHTGDVAGRDENGYITYVGRADDVFKASDYRISPFELESVLIEHPAVAEAAVVPAPDPVRLAVPKAFVVLVDGREPSRELAGEILAYCRENLAPYKRIRRLEFADLPKTISGKIRRVQLREAEAGHADDRPAGEYREDDFA
ncbi:acetyl-CoA synthetase [Jatrophihabitans endophyticus]|uniref:Acetyl-CoA synthetase n=1 Tax=Jatrophihabitans endophyticus TaxID=1206085 RepID=A0A1M5EAK8_9ACTN|nr:AMP-binding protein [Jatrophihabitans endophyticus]SHF76268.1 acetyl-CoA synthetase [Jatrophihabitans endophyticus]